MHHLFLVRVLVYWHLFPVMDIPKLFFYAPYKINHHLKIGKICQKCGYKNVLVVTDQTLSSLGYEQAITQALEEAEIHYAIYNDINSEPTIDLIEAGRKKAIECQAECVIALGGGSVMDTTKMIAAGAKMPRRSVKSLLIKFLPVPGKTLPMISVPSTAGTGAEVTVGAVVHNSQGVKTSTVLIGLDVTHVVLDSELLADRKSVV